MGVSATAAQSLVGEAVLRLLLRRDFIVGVIAGGLSSAILTGVLLYLHYTASFKTTILGAGQGGKSVAMAILVNKTMRDDQEDRAVTARDSDTDADTERPIRDSKRPSDADAVDKRDPEKAPDETGTSRLPPFTQLAVLLPSRVRRFSLRDYLAVSPTRVLTPTTSLRIIAFVGCGLGVATLEGFFGPAIFGLWLAALVVPVLILTLYTW